MYNKINKYVFIQILKSCTLIFFIFISIAWLLQVTRLFNLSNLVQIDIISIIYLSLFLIPNLLSILLPFIIIFGILLCFVKLNKDKEIVAIYTLGLSTKNLLIPLTYFTVIIILLQIILNIYFSPIIYKEYKLREFELRNTINIDKLMVSNFLHINENTIIDFKKNKNNYENIFINYKDEKDNIIFAKLGSIENNINEYVFKLSNGYKLTINQNKEIEKLEFTNYTIKFKNNKIKDFNNTDRNSLTIFDDWKVKDYKNIAFKFSDILIIVLIVYIFYNNNILKNKFNTKTNILFITYSIALLISNQLLKNTDVNINKYFLVQIFFIIIILISTKLNFFKNE